MCIGSTRSKASGRCKDVTGKKTVNAVENSTFKNVDSTQTKKPESGYGDS